MTDSEGYKEQVYKNWIARGRPWFNIDKSKEPTYAERQIIIEMKKREAGVKSKSDIELEKSAEQIRGKYRVNEVKRFDRLMKGDY